MATTMLRQFTQDVSPFLILLVAISTLGSLQFGFHLAELNAPQDVISCHAQRSSMLSRLSAAFSSSSSSHAKHAPLRNCIPMNDVQFAVVSSLFTLGGLVGALAGGPISSARGRLFAMRLTGLLFIVGSILMTLGGSIAVLSIGRILSGMGAGAATVIVPIYISEVAPPRERGTFGAMTQVSINVGILGTQTLGYFLSSESTWRWIFVVGIIIAALQILGLMIVPESPTWLATHKNVSQAKRTLRRIRGQHYDIEEETAFWDSSAASPETDSLLSDSSAAPADPSLRRVSVSSQPSGKSDTHLGFFQVVKDVQYRPALVAAIGVMSTQQLCGINSIIMYSVSLLKDLSPINSGVLTITVSAINLVTTIACSPLPDRLGRKTCLLLSIFGQAASALALALSIVLGARILSAFAVLLFVAFFAVGLGSVPFILASEMVDAQAVGVVQSCCLAASYITTFLVAQFFPIINLALNERFGGAGWVYFIFAGLGVLCGLFVIWRVPETKGKKDMDEVWGRTRRID
ncbi:general substrate transporter [Xylaria venustula]|nr:general substrate transporter [Xylaria venustula]